MRGKGLGLICRFITALRERSVPMLTTQPVARLALDSGRVTGVVLGSGEIISARRGVLLATGGYGERIEVALNLELNGVLTIDRKRPDVIDTFSADARH